MPPYTPFPVEVPYSTGPKMAKLGRSEGDSGQHFVVDELYGAYLEQKLTYLRAHPERYSGLSAGQHGGLEGALWHVFGLLSNEHPELVRVARGALWLRALGVRLERKASSAYRVELYEAPLSELGHRVGAYLDGQPGLHQLLHALALCIQEDVVILRECGEDEVEGLCVTFPSRWSPQEKLGQTFREVHGPVADNGALLKAHRPVMNALFHKGPFVRFVWGLSADDKLGQHPASPSPALPAEVVRSPGALAARLFFRTERQVSCPLPGFGRCLFTIRVSVQPLKQALYTRERQRRLAEALEKMSDALLAYKGLTAWREPLLAYLTRPQPV